MSSLAQASETLGAAASSSPSGAGAAYISSLLGSILHLYTSDGRMFAGEFKCTDKARNIILSRTNEYRMPSSQAVSKVAAERSAEGGKGANQSAKITVDASSRYVGLVVVPGQYITRIEVEESWESLAG